MGCLKGTVTGRAYVGFDRWGEADEVLEALKGLREEIPSNDVDDENVTEELEAKASSTFIDFRGKYQLPIQKVLEQKLPRGSKLGPRPARSEEKILDSLHNWEKHVNPAHLQELYDYGIKKEMLDTVFATMRYKNKSFGPVDLAMKGERLEPYQKIGGRFESAVRLYIKNLRGLLTSPEKPGMFAQSMFARDEEVDLELIDGPMEKEKSFKNNA